MRSIFVLLLFTHISQGIYDNSIGYDNIELGGLALYHNGKSYTISTEECPGGIFFTKKVTEDCLCYNGMFAVVRDCCTPKNETGAISVDTFEWRRGFQCGKSPEIGDPGGKDIKAVLPLTKYLTPFNPVLTFSEFGGKEFTKWIKFDINKLSSESKPVSFKGVLSVDILNIIPLQKQLNFSFGQDGDIEVCYEGWRVKSPQTLRIAVYAKSKRLNPSTPCCYKITSNNAPGIITSPCRSGAIITSISLVESVSSGKSCRLHLDTSVKRVKRSSDDENEEASEEKVTGPFIRYLLDDLENDSLDDQNRKLKIFQLMRKRGINKYLTQEPKTQRMMLLKQSVKVFQSKIVDEMVPKNMTDDAFEAFFFLYESLDWKNSINEQLDKKDLETIKVNLEKCFSSEPPVLTTFDSCPPTFKKLTVSDNGSTSEIPIPTIPSILAYEKTRHDIIIDIIWKIVDFVLTICAEHFTEDFTSLDLYGERMRSLFRERLVQKRWYRRIDPMDGYAKGVISNVHRELKMKEIDRAVAIAHSPFFTKATDWLPRPVVVNLKSQDPNYYNSIVKPYEESQLQEMIQDGRVDPKMALQEDSDSTEENSDNEDEDADLNGDPVERKKKQVRNHHHRAKPTPRLRIKEINPGDKIWDGLAICLDASFNDDRSYYSSDKLWGTKPSLVQLGKKYPW